MRILVIGGGGYLRSLLVQTLLKRGYETDVVDLLWFGSHLPDNIPVRNVDCLDLDIEVFRGYDQVIFIAGISNDPMADFSPTTNFVFNRRLLPLMVKDRLPRMRSVGRANSVIVKRLKLSRQTGTTDTINACRRVEGPLVLQRSVDSNENSRK